MAKNLWEVTFDAKYTHCGDLMEEKVKVVANGDGLTAVRKARREVIGMSFVDTERGRNCRVIWVKLTGLTLLHEIDA